MKKIKLPSIYSQWDSRWAKDILGYNAANSTYNLYNYGCLITCLAMCLEYYGKRETPGEINTDLKDGYGFHTNTGLYNWGSTRRIFNQIKGEEHVITPLPLTDEQLQRIKSSLDDGNPVILEIDVSPKTVAADMHFVLAIAYNPYDENDFTIADPLGGVERSLKDYLGWFRPSARKTIESFTLVTGDVANGIALKDMVIDFDDPEGKRRSVMWYVRAWFDQKASVANQKADYEKKLANKDTAFSTTHKLLETATSELVRKESKVQELNGRILKLQEENARLIDQNASLFGIFDLIKMALNKINLTPKG